MSNPLEQLVKSLTPDKKALLAEYLRPKPEPIAIIGMGCRFPGGITTPEAFWELLKQGQDSIIEVPADRWNADAYFDPNPDAPDKMYTRWGSFLTDAPLFDASFFGISPKEAQRMDPQHRLLLEVAWQALEDAGQVVDGLARSQTGVFIGLINNDYSVRQLQADGAACFSDPYFTTGSSASMAAGRLAYLFDLQGPTITLDTACSSSLVATHLAVQSLQSKESNLALVGGTNVIVLPDTFVNLCKMRMFSSDGRCKTFDAAADGFVMGEGCGFIVLKRLSDAISDGDHIRAIIRGSAVNEDGRSSNITAPNGRAQQAVIKKALAVAGVKPHQIGYVEAHGSGTSLGDPIEMEAIRGALGKGRAADQPLYVGAVKTNIGHLCAGAGVAGLMKTVLSLQHKQIPPHLNLKTLNPGIPRDGAPFIVPTALTPWPAADGGPRLAGVSSFGWSGTNAHIIVEEAPELTSGSAARPAELLVWSARTPAALDAATAALLAYLKANRAGNLADIAHTLQLGRKSFAQRRTLACRDIDQAIAALESGAAHTGEAVQDRPVALLFAGVGDHYAGMAQELYAAEPAFRATADRCFELLTPLLDQDLRALVYAQPGAGQASAGPDFRAMLGRGQPAAGPLHQTALAQPAVFVVEYALATLLQSWGIVPQAMLGYSLGEYVAATVAGVLSLEDALTLVARRAQLIQALPAGAMLAVSLGEADVAPYLSDAVGLAAVNSPTMCVLSGPPAALAEVAARLERAEVACRRVETSHAFHSSMLAPAQAELTALARELTLHPPRIPYISNVTGTWITPEQATDPAYWAEHMVRPVRFAAGVAALLQDANLALVEVGPGQALGSFVKQHPACGRERVALVLPTLPAQHERQSDLAALLTTLGRLWAAGAPVDWKAFGANQQRRSLPLPPYPFERQRFWVDLADSQQTFAAARPSAGKKADMADWFYQPVWEPAPLSLIAPLPASARTWLVFADAAGVGQRLAERLERAGGSVFLVAPGDAFAQPDARRFVLRPDAAEDYLALLRAVDDGAAPLAIAHLWSLDALPSAGPDQFAATQRLGLYSALALARALDQAAFEGALEIALVCSPIHGVSGDERLNPDQATLLGAAKVISQELQGIACRTIDLALPPAGSPAEDEALDVLARELLAPASQPLVAYRGNQRWLPAYRPVRLEPPAPALRQGGVYLITGGLGEIGLTLAEYMARSAQARLVLLGRSDLPERAAWPGWLASHPEDERTSRRIRAVQRCEALGAEVMTIAADVADVASLRAAIDRADQRFGGLHGVVHAAGLVEAAGFRSIQDSDLALCEAHFQPKAYGLYALEAALGERPLDFCVLFSSLSAVLGGLGFSAYAAANSVMDAFAQRHNQTHPAPWLSVNWDLWLGGVDQTATGLGATLTEYGMTPDEGAAAFGRVLAAKGLSQIVHSTGDLETRIRQWVRREPLDAGAAAKPAHSRPTLSTAYVPPRGEYEQRIAAIWQQALGLEQVGIQDNFFDLGGNSLVGIDVVAKLKKAFKVQLSTVALFEAPTISALATYLLQKLPQAEAQAPQPRPRPTRRSAEAGQHDDIAIIGMAGRFPGAASVDELWQNISNAHEAIATFSDEELLAAGISQELLSDPNYVKSRPVLKSDVGLFDAAFFGYSPREASFMDPQQRLFHECAWEALELAGYDSQRYAGSIGVFAGSSLSTYMLHLASLPAFADFGSDPTAYFSNDKDGLTTNVSYKLNLRGPSVAVQTYCSTSLVATHLACRSLRSGECDMALAGGVSIRVPVTTGYLYREGDQVSPDGHCRTFDAQAGGANFGDGVALVVLKRLADALADGDTIHAVIRGSAINNDGGLKVGYTAPSVVGQADAIIAALDDAGLPAESISYVEAHGTATKLGDPIEIASLTRAFRASTAKVGFCGISSVKPNIGHLDRAAGVTGLIKTVMALKHGVIPPTLHFQAPNPEIDFAASPFYVLARPTPWQRNGTPRRAVVNSLGVGGTNAHVILEEAPVDDQRSRPSRPAQLLVLSARTASALDAAGQRLAEHLAANPAVNLADVAYTLQIGRRTFEHRRILVCEDAAAASALLAGGDERRRFTRYQKPASRTVAFLFPGVGDHYAGMARDLYASEAVFRQTVDDCCRILAPLLDTDLKDVIYPADGAGPAGNGAPLDLRALLGRTQATGAAAGPLHQTALAQPAVFVIEYALTQLLASWGIVPQAMLGYSLGEYVAATVAGVLSLEDALTLVARRAQLIQALPAGAMLAVSLGEAEVAPYLSDAVGLATVNSPTMCVLAGPRPALDRVAAQLAAAEVATRWLETSHAFHSSMLVPAQAELTALAQELTLHPPRIPYISNVSGTWITPEQATDPAYWAEHMVRPVRFAAGVASLLQDAALVLVEVGPGQALGSFVKQHPDWQRERMDQMLSTLPAQHERQSDLAALLTTLGRLWLLDVAVDWDSFSSGEQRRRVPLPTYPFERQRFWLEPARKAIGAPHDGAGLDLMSLKREAISDWFYIPGWKQSGPHLPADDLAADACWLVFEDSASVGLALANWLREHGQRVVTVQPGAGYAKRTASAYTLNPARRADYDALLADLHAQNTPPTDIVHLWSVTPELPQPLPDALLEPLLEEGFYSLIYLAQALGDLGLERCRLSVVSNDMQSVTGAERLCPEKATVTGPCKLIQFEYAAIDCRSIDIALPPPQSWEEEALIAHLLGELTNPLTDPVVALRGNRRWVQSLERVRMSEQSKARPRLRQGGAYLITGGLGGIGLALAEHLARTQQARLALVGRSGLPPRGEWPALLRAQPADEALADKIRRIQALEALGSEVLVLQADVADQGQIEAAVQRALGHFGELHGAIHAAGVPGIGLISLKTREAAAQVLAPKVQGTRALAQALAGLRLDFLALFSSVAALTGGGAGQVDYCAANAFLDAFAQSRADQPVPVVAIDWGEWVWNGWEAAMSNYDRETQDFFREHRQRFGIGFAEGADALERILAQRFANVVVSTQDFPAILRLLESAKIDVLKQAEAPDTLHPRPDLATSYVVPQTKLEQAIAEVWSERLGIAAIGLNDNFFELGGNSLIGVDLLNRLRKRLNISQIPAYALYEAPTVGALAKFLEPGQEQQTVAQERHDRGAKRRDRQAQLKRGL